ncbi:ketopantoate reductase family protein [Mycobacteroides abscessus]|uniref:ketopantoate reductase family protein n=1 Tax=Mycobacteroides abscessus TaxID=36809 RepID=UPI0009D47381|nr:2-dehydropantoate 2-reductase [Mycobacteroides abscessus]SLF47132.1 Probable ketopantoate reductase ApbA/PanE [Mycobacteroides abscessus subsp. abscessus]
MSEIASVTVMGAGATGGYLAAVLTKAGVPVTVIARGSNLEQIRSDGIKLEHADGEREVVRLENVLPVEEVDVPADLVLFCVKSYSTVGAAADLVSLVSDKGRVVCLQNGMRNEQILAAAVGKSRLLSGILYIAAERLSPGIIRCSVAPSLIVGPYTGTDLGASSDVQALLDNANISCRVEPDTNAMKWQKFLFNCGLNPLTAITKKRLGDLLATPETAEVFQTLVTEAATVALAAGAPLAADYQQQVDDTAKRMDISSSMAEDLTAGREIELDAFTGYVIELGTTHNVPTPVTRTLHGLLVALSNAGLPPTAHTPQALQNLHSLTRRKHHTSWPGIARLKVP